MKRRRWFAALVAAAAVAGCGSHSGGGNAQPPPFQSGPSHTRLVAAAHLAPCPGSAANGDGELPHVTLRCLGAGPAVHLAGLAGRPMVVNLWAAWCTECHTETGYLAAAYSALGNRVRFLGVDTNDSDANALSYAAHATPRMRYPSVADPGKSVLLGLHLSPGLPQTVFVSSDGAVVHVARSPYRSAAQLTKDISTYLHVA